MRYDDDEVHDAPPAVVAAVSIGTVPLPFLFVYAALFILHGLFSPVHPPDITSSQHGELLAGLVAAAVFVVMTVTLLWFLNRRRRWPFAVTQLVIAGVAVWFLSDQTKGGAIVSLVVLVATLVALAFGFHPSAWNHLGLTTPPLIRRAYAVLPVGSSTEPSTEPAAGDPAALPQSTPPTAVKPSSLRRRRSSSSR